MKKNEPIRVAHIIGKWLGGGVETVVMNYYRNIDRSKVQFDFLCDSDSTNIPYDDIEKLGGKVILIPPYQKAITYQKELIKIFKENQYRIVHSHISTMSIFPLRAAKKAGVSVRIAHAHSTSNKKEWKKNVLKQILRPFSKVYATDYMCCSELAGRWLFGNKEYDKGNVYLLNNAIDLDKFKYDKKLRDKKRKELNISEDTLVIGHVGRFVEQKNHRFLIDIFNEVNKENNNSLLLLAGQGPLMDEIKEKVKELNLTENVKFLGQRNDVDELYQAFDVFCLPSLYEGLPVVGVEAQASGLLSILSNDMTRETKVLDSTVFMRLNNAAEEWANQFINLYSNYKRNDSTREFTIKNFNIKEEHKKLCDFYINIYNKKVKVISFDIFDTLVKKIYTDIELFNIIEEYLKDKKIEVENYAKRRKQYEKEFDKYPLCFTLNDIYNKFTELSELEKKELMKIEKSFVINNMTINKKGYNIYKSIKGRKICISDMYLEKETIELILNKCGYDDIEEVFISSSYKDSSKKNKKLFKEVQKKYNITSHYGDAKRSDFINPYFCNIKGHLIINKNNKNKFDIYTDNYFHDVGANIFGPVIFEFSKWINNNTLKYRNEKFLFLSREGYYLKKVYDKMYNTNSEMLYVSRNSIIKGSALVFLTNLKFEEYLDYFNIKKNTTINEFFQKIGITCMDNFINNMDSVINSDIYNSIINNKSVLNELKSNNDNFNNYITSKISNKNVLIDVGWNGTMQNYLNDYYKLLHKKISFRGLYLGCLNTDNKEGYLFNNTNRLYEQIMCFSGLLENIFMPMHGSVKGYDNNHNPIFGEVEYSTDTQIILNNIQTGMDDFIEFCLNFDYKNTINFNCLTTDLIHFGLYPKLKDIKKFKGIELYDHHQVLSLVYGDKSKNILKNFLRSKWKSAYLKSIIKINIDHSKMISFFRKIMK